MSELWTQFGFAWTLFRDAILCAVFAGAGLGVLSVLVVLRRRIFAAAALSQAAALGAALSWWWAARGPRIPPMAGAIAGTLAAAGALSARVERWHLPPELTLAVVVLGSSLGTVLVSTQIAQEAQDIAALLFGSAVLVTRADLIAVASASSLVLVGVALWARPLIQAGFDPEGARVQGLPVRALDSGWLLSLAVLAGLATRALGALPVFAFSVLPGTAALLAAPGMYSALWLAPALGALSGLAGYALAFVLDLPVGATQAACALALVGLAAPVRIVRGWRARRRPLGD